MKHEGWTLAPEGRARLDRYERLLETRAVPAGLVARADVPDLRERHVDDSLRGAPLLSAGSQVADLGSGAGLPGIPLAIALPDVRFSLVDSRRSRIAFLELVVDDLGLSNVSVLAIRAEEVPPGFDDCLARGFGGPAASWEAAERLLRPGGRLLYWAGSSFDVGDLPESARLVGLGEPALESGGPIVIMARQ